MAMFVDPHQIELRSAGWHSRGYLPHFDGIELPQFITIHLADSIPPKVIKRWKEELKSQKHQEHFQRTIQYIENNPVKARLCARPSDWPFGSAWQRKGASVFALRAHCGRDARGPSDNRE